MSNPKFEIQNSKQIRNSKVSNLKLRAWNLFRASIFVLGILSTVFSFFAGRTYAAPQPIPGGRIPCDVQKDPEFNSSRPYQASPCGDSPKAYFCGNSLQVIEDTPSRNAPLGTKFLPVNFQMGDKNYAADLTGASFPIEGNTELTANSVNPVGSETLDDATKMNEYVSWYLNGVTNRAEYGSDKNSNDYIVNFSGPVQKLLPSAIQDAQRLIAIQNASKKTTYSDESGKTLTDKTQNHNQIVVCSSRELSTEKLFGIIPLPALKNVPHECYAGNKSAAIQKEYRLKDWGQGNLSPLNTFFNFLGTQKWNSRYPPLPWQFTKDVYYQKAYREWKGNVCSIVPFVNQLVCLPDPTNTREWSDLYQHVPLSNTTDKNAKNLITGVGINGLSGTQIEKPATAYKVIQEPVLYFPHTAETSELSNALNSTYVPKTGTVKTAPSATTESNYDNVGQCRITNLRSNPGDYLFPEVKPSEVRVYVAPYTVTQIPCHDVQEGPSKRQVAEGIIVKPHAVCRGQVAIEIRMVTKVPYAEDLFNSTTAGANSTFRKIYPKVSEGAPVTCIANLPTETSVQYIPTEGINDKSNFKVIGPSGKNTTDNAKLYFPYIGSVYDYFLKGIQQALRPQGYGEGVPQNGQYCGNITCGELPKNLPKGTGTCNLGSSSINIPQSFKSIISAAAETYKVPPNLILGIMYGEGAFNPGRYNWTEQNVKNWASCQKLPNCTPGGSTINSVVPFIGVYWNKLATSILPDLKKIDPAKQKADPCNLLDATFGLAKDLSTNKNGGSFGSLTSCLGIPLNTGSSKANGCAWSSSDYETAIKVWENGFESSCFTKEGSCATGGGEAAACPTGGDSCETLTNRYPNASHNACVWDVATSGSGGNRR